MPIMVDLANPPPYVVVVHFDDMGATDGHVTWPFETYDAAVGAYTLALQSGQFTHCIRRATKKQPALFVHHVSLWRREHTTSITGEPMVEYIGCPPWVPEPAATEQDREEREVTR